MQIRCDYAGTKIIVFIIVIITMNLLAMQNRFYNEPLIQNNGGKTVASARLVLHTE